MPRPGRRPRPRPAEAPATPPPALARLLPLVGFLLVVAAALVLVPGWSTLLVAGAAGVAGVWFGRNRAGRTGGGRTLAGGSVASEPTASVERTGPADLARVLRLLREELGARRLVVWSRDREADEIRPLLGTEDPPPSRTARGEPLAWALDEHQLLRLERPVWAQGSVTAVPVPPRGSELLLTVEAGAPSGPDAEGALRPPESAARAAELLGVVLDLSRRNEAAAAGQARFRRMLAFLRDVAHGPADDAFAEGLARAAAELTGADGALVAAWAEERGWVLARWGVGGGPAPGDVFTVGDGTLAIAARAGAAVHRGQGGGSGVPPLAEEGERWTRRPRHTVALPLRSAEGRVDGVVGLWGRDVPADEGLGILDALGPLLALQLGYVGDLVQFRRRAVEDALTGLPNRGALEERLEHERQRFHRYRRSLALMVLDLDHFKRINDTYGHPAGDAVLARVAEVVASCTRDSDFSARYGGEELVVLMPETGRRAAGEVAERVRATLAETRIEWSGTVIPVTASIGVSACPESVDDPSALLASADEALYASKERGRNRVTVAAPTASGG